MKRGGHGNEHETEGPHPAPEGFHGKYPHKDSSSIENAPIEQMERMKTFKGAKNTKTQWLTKKNAVNQMTNAEYHPHKGQEEL